MPATSRWFVGSSSSSKSGASAKASASAARLRSPPEAFAGSSVAALSIPMRCRYSSNLASTRHRSRSSRIFAMSPRSTKLSRMLSAGGSTGSCSTSTIRTPSLTCRSPSSSDARPAMIATSEDFPVPFRPISPIRSPSWIENEASSSRGSRPNARWADCKASRVTFGSQFSQKQGFSPLIAPRGEWGNQGELEARAGVEPTYSDLQSGA